MKYQTEITEAFKKCGFEPRDGQVEYCEKVLTAYLDEGFKTVVLNAPTGTGKSILGAVIAEVLEEKLGKTGLGSFLLMGQNVLAQQYLNTFIDNRNKGSTNFVFLKGANNFKCSALSGEEEITAENCALGIMQSNGMDDVIDEHCKSCEFMRIKKLKNECRNLITNYSYYFVDRMYLKDTPACFEKRTIAVFDEAQTINDLFVEHNAIYFSEKRIKSFEEEVAKALSLGNTEVFSKLKKIRTEVAAGRVTDKNYLGVIRTLHEAYKAIAAAAETEAKSHIRSISKYNALMSISKKYFNLGCKIGDLLIYQYEHIFEFKPETKEVIIKAVFCGEMFKELVHSDFLLFMSATITKEYLVNTLNLSPAEIKFVQLEPTFPAEMKKVVFWSPLQLNYTAMKDPKTVSTLQSRVKTIVHKHTGKSESGIILTPSFEITRMLAEPLKSEKGVKVFEHKQGEKLADVLAEFKKCSVPSVLVSPSLFEGISLDGELSRYQVMVKAPYPSLGDKRMKHILDKYPQIYEFITLLKVIQGCGRSTRNADDYSVTYMLDNNLQRLWRSEQNIWKGEFSTNFTSILMED